MLREPVYLPVAQQRKEGYNLPSLCIATIGGIHIQTHRLMEGIYELRRWDGLRCLDIHTKFHKDLFSHSKFNSGDTHTDTHRQQGYFISLLLYFQNKKNGLRTGCLT
jgi:hypothetical protein